MKSLIAVLAFTCSTFAFATTDYACVGVEPFFTLNLVGSKLSLSMPLGDDAVTEEVISRIAATNYSEETAFVVKTASASATFVAGNCKIENDDDVKYTSYLVYNTEDSVYYGCCNKIEK